MLQLSRKWSTRPPSGSQLNAGHPLTRGMVGCWLFNEGAGMTVYDLLGQNDGTITNPPSSGQGGLWVPMPGGPGQLTGIAMQGINNFPATTVTVNNPLFGSPACASIVCIAYPLSDVGHFNPIASWGGGVVQVEYDFNNLTAGFWGTQDLGSGNTRDLVIGTPGQYNRLAMHSVYVVDPLGTVGTAGLSGYLNGVLAGTVSSTGSTFWPDAGTTTTFGGGNAIIGQVIFYNRALTYAEAQQLYVEPYCFVLPPNLPRSRYFFYTPPPPPPPASIALDDGAWMP